MIELATPGGLVNSMREICTSMLGSEIPVAVYVAPAGSHAASAGFFILMASDIAAMAPGTNTGAAAAVGGQGEEIEGTMGKKVQEDGAAYIRSLASRKGRNIEMAEAAVLEAKSFSAEEALENNLIDRVVPSVTRLLVEIDGREIEKNGRTVTTAGQWWKQRRPEIVEDFEREVVGRIPRNVPKVEWIVTSINRAQMGGIDVVANNAGIGAQGTVADNDDAEWLRVLDVNVLGIVRVTRAALPYLRESPHAAVVNTCSIAATAGGCTQSTTSAPTVAA